MIKKLILIMILATSQTLFAQNLLKAYIKDEISGNQIIGASAYFDSLKIGVAADNNGLIKISNIPDGEYSVRISCIGYEAKTIYLTFPRRDTTSIETYFLKPKATQFEDIVVLSTMRNNRVKANSPNLVEVLGQEEVNEEISIRPGNISKLLSETSGIMVQQTSPILGNVSFRLQGLPGEYTQLLKDGFPYYSGLSAGLSLLQIPPLDLRQVEVIKGSFSTLYGTGAIAGIVNLITREPSEYPEWTLILNHTSRNGTDIGSYYLAEEDNTGISFLASQGIQDAVDIDGDGFTDIPSFKQVTLNPKLFYQFTDSSSLTFSLASFFETRSGGDISAIRYGPDSLHQYIEKNDSKRINTQLNYHRRIQGKGNLQFKNSFDYAHRNITVLNSYFSGTQYYSFSELSSLFNEGQHSTVLGLNITMDSFRRMAVGNQVADKYDYYTLGSFVQDDWNISSDFIFEAGFRFDYHNKYGVFPIPHLSALFKFSKGGSIRLSAGSGYRTPTLNNSLDNRDIVRNKVTLSPDVESEVSRGMNLDVSYKYISGLFMMNVNQAFFYTYVDDPLIPDYLINGDSSNPLTNTSSSISSRGFDTNFILAFDELNAFIDYTFAKVRTVASGTESSLILTPESKLNITLTYEGEGSWRSGIEVFYTGSQHLNNLDKSKAYWLFGAMFEKTFHKVSIVCNVENILDERQSKLEPVVLPPSNDPVFMPLFEPLDGLVANVALKLQLK